MREIVRTAKPVLQALISTAAAIGAFAGLSAAGLAAEPSLAAALIVAGTLNIWRLASLNADALVPTCRGQTGELSR